MTTVIRPLHTAPFSLLHIGARRTSQRSLVGVALASLLIVAAVIAPAQTSRLPPAWVERLAFRRRAAERKPAINITAPGSSATPRQSQSGRTMLCPTLTNAEPYGRLIDPVLPQA